MLRRLVKTWIREVSSSKLQEVPKDLYDSAMSYINSLRLRALHEGNDVQREVWEKEAELIESMLKAIKDLRMEKVAKSLIKRENSIINALPPEEAVLAAKLRESFELAFEGFLEAERGEEIEDEEGKVALLVTRRPPDELLKKVKVDNLEQEDVMFINRRAGKLLISLGFAEEVKVRR